MLWDMTFAQLLTMVETRNNRERRAYERAQEEARRGDDDRGGYIRPPKKDLLAPENLPKVSEVRRIFGGF